MRGRIPPDEEVRVPVVEEDVIVEKRPVATGKVQVRKRITERQETVDLPLMKEHVDVRRVVVDRPVEAIPEVRREGDTIVIPIVEEVLVVEKRLVLKEELHVTRRRSVERHEENVTLRRQETEVQRVEPDGSVTPLTDKPPVRQNRPLLETREGTTVRPRTKPRKRLLE